MISPLFRGLGKLALFLATLAFLVVMTLFVGGSFILTWPLHRLSPRDRRIKATMDLAQSGMAWVTIFSEGNLRKMMAEAMDEGDGDANTAPIIPHMQDMADFLNWATHERGSWLTGSQVLTFPDVENLMDDYTHHRELLDRETADPQV